ncbi:MAG: plastocyanin/azurin family copper-binding protein, partial [Candidatus Nitrosomaritimum yanchengensis]
NWYCNCSSSNCIRIYRLLRTFFVRNYHTVTSGNIIEGPDGLFDSGLIKAGETFSFKFEKTGEYGYFCMIHPWANGSVTVS